MTNPISLAGAVPPMKSVFAVSGGNLAPMQVSRLNRRLQGSASAGAIVRPTQRGAKHSRVPGECLFDDGRWAERNIKTRVQHEALGVEQVVKAREKLLEEVKASSSSPIFLQLVGADYDADLYESQIASIAPSRAPQASRTLPPSSVCLPSSKGRASVPANDENPWHTLLVGKRPRPEVRDRALGPVLENSRNWKRTVDSSAHAGHLYGNGERNMWCMGLREPFKSPLRFEPFRPAFTYENRYLLQKNTTEYDDSDIDPAALQFM